MRRKTGIYKTSSTLQQQYKREKTYTNKKNENAHTLWYFTNQIFSVCDYDYIKVVPVIYNVNISSRWSAVEFFFVSFDLFSLHSVQFQTMFHIHTVFALAKLRHILSLCYTEKNHFSGPVNNNISNPESPSNQPKQVKHGKKYTKTNYAFVYGFRTATYKNN